MFIFFGQFVFHKLFPGDYEDPSSEEIKHFDSFNNYRKSMGSKPGFEFVEVAEELISTNAIRNHEYEVTK